MKRFTIDGCAVASLDDFITAVNRGFVEHVGGRYELELLGSEICRAALSEPWRGQDADAGQTLFDVIREILAENKHVRVLLR